MSEQTNIPPSPNRNQVAEEAAAVQSVLGLVESLLELSPSPARAALESPSPSAPSSPPPLLSWLVARLKPRGFDAGKLCASELLAIWLQGSPGAGALLGAAPPLLDGLLSALAPYRSRDPASEEEEEHLANAFGALCCVVMASPACKAAFVAAEGVELLLLLVKGGGKARPPALRAMDFALARCPAACERLVDVTGLKTAFAVFMGKAAPGRRRPKEEAQAEEEHALSVMAQLFAGLAKGGRRDRAAAKFVESGEARARERPLRATVGSHSRSLSHAAPLPCAPSLLAACIPQPCPPLPHPPPSRL